MKVVHIGFPKTATTFLQRGVFPYLPSRYRYFDEQASAGFFAPLIHADDTIFDAAGLKRRVEAAWGNECALFSFEPLTGLHHQTGFVNRTPIAKRLHYLGFERVIITIRNQPDVLESAYKQYVASGGGLRFDDYVSFAPDTPRYLYPEYYDYEPIFRLYADTFGHANVLVLQYENLREESFMTSLCDFLAVDPFAVDFDARVNQSLSAAKTKILRAMNCLAINAQPPWKRGSRWLSTGTFHGVLARLPFLNERTSCLGARNREQIAAFYRNANRRLERQAGITLSPAYP